MFKLNVFFVFKFRVKGMNMSEKLTIFFKPLYISILISPEQYVQAKSNKDILHAICIVQIKSNRYIH